MKLKWLVAAIAYLAVDSVVVIETPSPSWVHWNWLGKLASLALASLTIVVLRLTRDEVGLVWPRKRNATIVGIAVAIAFSGALNAVFATGEPTSIEAVLFQATMPGLAEELVYRGVAFALLVRALRSQRAAAIVSTLAFAAVHGVSPAGVFILPALYAAAVGGWLAWIRCRTGSLVGCVAAHNAANVAGTLVATL
jgi:uncharacterized protein